MPALTLTTPFVVGVRLYQFKVAYERGHLGHFPVTFRQTESIYAQDLMHDSTVWRHVLSLLQRSKRSVARFT